MESSASTQATWTKIEAEIARYDLLQHPFYKAWSAGELTTEDLKFYAGQYYNQVSAFPTYLTTLHARLPEGVTRRKVLSNAFDEECAEFAHSDLWLRFLEGMGGDASACTPSAAIPEVRDMVKTFRSLAEHAPLAAVFGALFAYVSQVPKIAAEKLAGLKKHYAADDRTCSYFALHRVADVQHSNVWRQIINELLEKDELHDAEVFDGVSKAARALWSALDGIERDRPTHAANGYAATAN